MFDGTYLYEYDAEGNRTLRYIDNPEYGEEAVFDDYDFDITVYTWDHRNRLTAVEFYATYEHYDYEVADQTVTYNYDPMNRLIGRDVFFNELPNSRQAFIYDGNQIITVQRNTPLARVVS
ncbi:MAG: hypothetical protein JW818_12035 [Pirellulales bacterium]|nr:hypothetical protein [Pirellulales bacterium]